jgi:Secretion system C-terminal sorting domain
MQHTLTILLVVLNANAAFSQSIAPQVVNTCGGTAAGNSGILEWSLGEIAITTATSPSNMLTQGVLQPQLYTVATEDVIQKTKITVFPNPTESKLYLETNEQIFEQYTIIEASGKLIRQSQFTNEISVNDLQNGVYWLQLITKDAKNNQTIKFVKQ